VDNQIVKLGDDDKAYSFEWIEDKQHWWDMKHEAAFDPRDLAHQVLVVHDISSERIMNECQTWGES
jgi:hypothetical protein